MTRPGNREIHPQELAQLLGGELPDTLPLEGWRTLTLHCQVDAIGPSDRHPDLVQLEVSFPPAKPAAPCSTCRGRGTIPDLARWDAAPVPCPECDGTAVLCTATMLHALCGRVQCAEPAGHYDEARMPAGGVDAREPGGWHYSAPDRDGRRFIWSDQADGVVPHEPRCPTSL